MLRLSPCLLYIYGLIFYHKCSLLICQFLLVGGIQTHDLFLFSSFFNFQVNLITLIYLGSWCIGDGVMPMCMTDTPVQRVQCDIGTSFFVQHFSLVFILISLGYIQRFDFGQSAIIGFGPTKVGLEHYYMLTTIFFA